MVVIVQMLPVEQHVLHTAVALLVLLTVERCVRRGVLVVKDRVTVVVVMAVTAVVVAVVLVVVVVTVIAKDVLMIAMAHAALLV